MESQPKATTIGQKIMNGVAAKVSDFSLKKELHFFETQSTV